MLLIFSLLYYRPLAHTTVLTSEEHQKFTSWLAMMLSVFLTRQTMGTAPAEVLLAQYLGKDLHGCHTNVYISTISLTVNIYTAFPVCHCEALLIYLVITL